MTEDISPELSRETQKSILDWCLALLKAKLSKAEPPEGPALAGKGAVFVTLKREGSLRGCIGSFNWDHHITEMISRMTLAAAFDDYRFSPLTLPELEGLEITVSVLPPLEQLPLEKLPALSIGRDGLYLLPPRGRGVLLPVVAEEQGWGPVEFAEHTSRKAGLHRNAYKDDGAQLMVFRAPAFSTSDFA